MRKHPDPIFSLEKKIRDWTTYPIIWLWGKLLKDWLLFHLSQNADGSIAFSTWYSIQRAIQFSGFFLKGEREEWNVYNQCSSFWRNCQRIWFLTSSTQNADGIWLTLDVWGAAENNNKRVEQPAAVLQDPQKNRQTPEGVRDYRLVKKKKMANPSD